MTRNLSRTLLIAVTAALPLAGAAQAFAAPQISIAAQEQSRSVSGKVLTPDDAPVAQAVVYLKNTKTLVVKTFISDQDGNYRFQGLTPNTDYEVYAEHAGQRTSTKTLSAFDSRSAVTLNLHLEKK